MKTLRTLFICLCLLGLAATAGAEDTVRIRVQMIAADQKAGPSDPALAPLLSKLKRMPYERFQQKASRTVLLTNGTPVHAALAGHTMILTLQDVQNGRARVHVDWKRGRASVAGITAVTQPGSPFVCGGPREGDLTWIAVFSVQ